MRKASSLALSTYLGRNEKTAMNRKQRRAKIRQTNDDSEYSHIKSADDIPMSMPNSTASPKTKTLFEIAAERQSQLQPGTKPFSTVDSAGFERIELGADGRPKLDSSDATVSEGRSEVEETPWLDTFFLATSLSAIHFTLEVLTVHQYAQELLFKPIIMHTLFRAWPTLVFLVHLFHGHLLFTSMSVSERTKDWMFSLKQFVYLGIANGAGCYLIGLTNDRGYYAVMKNAPSIGTLWVWAVIEMGLVGALLGVLGPGIYAWWYGYGIL